MPQNQSLAGWVDREIESLEGPCSQECVVAGLGKHDLVSYAARRRLAVGHRERSILLFTPDPDPRPGRAPTST